jgi:hypothetical protein
MIRKYILNLAKSDGKFKVSITINNNQNKTTVHFLYVERTQSTYF